MMFILLQKAIVIICYFHILLIIAVKGDIIRISEDKKAEVGVFVILECSTDLHMTEYAIEWHHKGVNGKDFTIVYKNGLIFNGFHGRANVTRNLKDGEYNLVIYNVILDDAGTYTCMENTGKKKKFELTVLEHSLGETSRPLNRAVAKGDKVQLNCSTQERENGYWKYTKPFENNYMRIYNGDKVVNGMTNLFSVNDSVQGHFNLLFNASESTSGRYTCQPDLNMADQSAEVIVLDTSPTCSMTVTSGIINASCRIDFSGNWAPKMQWHNMNGRLETNDTTTIANSRVTSFLILSLDETDILTCTPMFELESKPHETTATNVPDLLINCMLTIGSLSDDVSAQPTAAATTTTSLPLYITGLVPCVCVLIFIIVLLCMRKRFTKSSRYEDSSEVVPKRKAVKSNPIVLTYRKLEHNLKAAGMTKTV